MSEPSSVSSAQWSHCCAELTGLSPTWLNDLEQMRAMVIAHLGAQGIGVTCALTKQFSPQGVSLVYVGAQLRVVVHTWPELGCATLDVRVGVPDVRRVTSELAEAISNRAKVSH